MTYCELSLDEVSASLQATERCLVLTGAGISVASGLPVYRGVQGSLYEEPDQLRDAMASTLHRDPGAYWRRHAMRRQACAQAKPNAAHCALVTLARCLRERGADFLLATQNVDNLHQRAGQRQVCELHGNVFKLRCIDLQCPHRERDDASPELVDSLEAPTCIRCGSALRPDLVLFGEGDDARWEPVRAFAAEGLDLVIFIGTSGIVAAPESLLLAATEAGQAPYVLDLNPSPEVQPYLAALLHGRLQMRAEEALPALVERLMRPQPH